MVSQGFRHFIGFLFTVFFLFFLFFNYQSENSDQRSHQKVLKVFAPTSFSASGGPGRRLAEVFENECRCRVEFVEASDPGILLQRLKIEGESLGADLVLGLSSYDVLRATSETHWRKASVSGVEIYGPLRAALSNEYFYPYAWNVFLPIGRSDGDWSNIKHLQDLLSLELRGKIGLEDPRTSALGLAFLAWSSKVFGSEQINSFLSDFLNQLTEVYSSSQQMEKDFLEGKLKIIFSFVNHPLLEEKSEAGSKAKMIALEEAHPIYYEFLGIPEFCQNCELSQKFVQLILSAEGQRILVGSSSMLSVLPELIAKEAQEKIDALNLSKDVDFVSERKKEAWLRKWAELRRR